MLSSYHKFWTLNSETHQSHIAMGIFLRYVLTMATNILLSQRFEFRDGYYFHEIPSICGCFCAEIFSRVTKIDWNNEMAIFTNDNLFANRVLPILKTICNSTRRYMSFMIFCVWACKNKRITCIWGWIWHSVKWRRSSHKTLVTCDILIAV